MLRRPLIFACLILAANQASTSPSRLMAEEPAPKITRVRGIIDRDQTWSGHILLTGDVSIEHGTVTVEPGTLIEFAGDPKASPVLLRAGSRSRRSGRIVLQGTADHPIEFKAGGIEPCAGQIEVHIFPPQRGPLTDALHADADHPQPERWRHVRFVSLRPMTRPDFSKRGGPRELSAISVRCHDSASLTLEDCDFTDSHSVELSSNSGGSVDISRCRFTQPRERRPDLLVRVHGEPGRVAIAEVVGNVALNVTGQDVQVSRCVLVGRGVSIRLAGADPDARIRLQSNYVHNTENRYSSSTCAALPGNAIAAGNFFRSSGAVVSSACRDMHENILLMDASDRRRNPGDERGNWAIRTVPPGSTHTRNLIIGPAYSLIEPTAAGDNARFVLDTRLEPIVIDGNTFDGVDRTSRAMKLANLVVTRTPIIIHNNLFLRVSAIVYDEGRRHDTLLYADYNAVAPPAPRGFDQAVVKGKKPGDEGWGMHDIIADDPRKLGLGPLPDRIPDYDEEILSGQMTIDEVREKIFDLYRPRPGSPLIGAGRKVNDQPGEKAANIGLSPKE